MRGAKQPVRQKAPGEIAAREMSSRMLESLPLWELDIVELTGHNLEARGREEVNRLLAAGWRLLLIYTLKYEEDGVWRERPMGILGKLRNSGRDYAGSSRPQKPSSPETSL